MTKLVWLDAGHGGRDPGAVGQGLQEKDIVLQLTNRIGAYLTANYNGVQARYSRTTDAFVTLAERVRLANNARADIFVSVHCNSAANAQANGFESFIFNGNVSNATQQLQTAIHNEVWDFYRNNSISSNRGMKRANLQVLRTTNMPAVLTENLFMPNPEILNFNREEFMQGVAIAHAEGIAQHLGLTKKSNNTNTAPTSPVPNNAEQYKVVTDIDGFTTAADAKANRNRRTTVRTGTYYVFNRSNGMINVSTSRTQPGSWINPTHNTTGSQNTTPAPSTTIKVGDRVELAANRLFSTGAATSPVRSSRQTAFVQVINNSWKNHIRLERNKGRKDFIGFARKADLTRK